MVKAEVGSLDLYRLSEDQAPPTEGSISRVYSDSVCLTKAPQINNPTRYYRSTYDFSSPKRYKSVVRLEPTLAPIRYYRAINFGISKELRHKSTVDCDFRPRARGFSETTWIFPKQGRYIHKSTYERNRLVDVSWYKSQVSFIKSDDTTPSVAASPGDKSKCLDYSSNDEGVFETENHNGEYTSSEEGDVHHMQIINNNNMRTKASVDSLDLDNESNISLSSTETDVISP